MMHLALFVIGKSITTKDFKRNVLIWDALISKISRGAHRLSTPHFSSSHTIFPVTIMNCLQVATLLRSKRSIIFMVPLPHSLVTSNRPKCNAASAITPEGNVVKGAVVIVEMWKRLPFFHHVAPIFEGGLGSKVLASGAPPNTWPMRCCRFDPII